MAYTTIPASGGAYIKIPATQSATSLNYRTIPSGTFLPTNVSSLTLWLNADTVSGNDGDAIQTWPNQSSVGVTNDWTQATAGKRPLLKKNIINGHATLLFDGSDDVMSSSMVAAAGAASMYVVFKATSLPGASSAMRIVGFKSATPDFFTLSLLNVAGYQPYHFMGKVVTLAATGLGTVNALTTASHSFGLIYSGGDRLLAASYTATLDCISQVVIASGSTSGNTGTETNGLGGQNISGSTFQPLAGHVAEVCYFSEALSAANQALMSTYICTKYGL